MIVALHRIKDAAQTAALWLAIGFMAGYTVGNPPRKAPAPIPPAPAPSPAPVHVPTPKPAPAPVPHNGHITVSYLEPRYGSPASAAVRDALAAVDWHSLDCTFRSYVQGQPELTTLGFVPHFTVSDLPVCFVQETGPKGAPIIDRLPAPQSAQAVLDRLKELRGK